MLAQKKAELEAQKKALLEKKKSEEQLKTEEEARMKARLVSCSFSPIVDYLNVSLRPLLISKLPRWRVRPRPLR